MSNDYQLEPVNKYQSTLKLTTTNSEMGIYEKDGCISGRTGLEKMLLFIVTLTLAVAIAACVAIAIVAQQDGTTVAETVTSPAPTDVTTTSPPEDSDICVTKGCVAAAARVNDYIDDEIKPCDNFFQYACGNWIRKNPIPEDRSSLDTFGVLRDEVEVALKDLLEAPSDEQELSPLIKAKRMYQSCMNESLIEERGLQPLESLFAILGQWPLLNDTWDGMDFDLVQILIQMKRHGHRPLVEQYVSTDYRNSSARVIVIDQPSLIMPGRDYYNQSLTPTAIPALTQYILSLAEAFGSTNGNLENDVEDMVEFETEIAKLTIPSEDRRDSNKLYNRMTIEELSANVSNKFDWHGYLNGIMSMDGVDISITTDEPVIVQSPVYLKNLFEILETTSNRTIANYIISYIIVQMVGTLPQNIRNLQTEYRKVLYGTQTARARWRTCVGVTRDALEDAVGRMFVDAKFDEAAKGIALSMISGIRDAFTNLLNDIDWMDEATRAVAEDKAAAIGENIGYSDSKIKNDTVLLQTYSNIDYSTDKYFENALKAKVWGSTKSLKRLREPVDKSEWGITPAIVNAFYSSTKNHITFPAGILQPPFFFKDYPKSMNYGGIGLVIGHEITHGFDDRGRQFDKDGNLKQWWTDEVIEKFKNKTQCIVDQYSNYTVPEADMNLKGVNTQGENIADNGGLRQAFIAYRDWVKEQGMEEKTLPGVELTHSQLFFVNFAQIWCGTMRRENAIERILTGVHSPGRFRVIGSLHNSQEFSEVFNCPKESYMNPERKCRVW